MSRNQQIDREMPLVDHLAELRKRLLVVLGLFSGFFVVGYFGSRPILYWVIQRSDLRHLAVIGITEAFFGLVKVDFVLSLIAVSPVLLYQTMAFILPGLTRTEKTMVSVLVIPGMVLFAGGTAVGFFWFVPIVLTVMLSFTGHGIVPLWTLSNYLSFVIDLSLPFGLFFELPLVSAVLSYHGMIRPGVFVRYRRYAVLGAFVLAAILAPPDALSMLLMAIPFYLIYELSHVVALVAENRGKLKIQR